MRNAFLKLASAVFLTTIALTVPALEPTPSPTVGVLPGQQPDGSVLLPNQWSLRPVGQQVPLGDLPVNIAVHPDGRFAAVMHSGHGKHEIIVVDVIAAKVVSHTEVREAFYGLEFSSSGSRVYCSGSSDEVVHVFDFKDGQLTPNKDIRVCAEKERGVPGGMAVSANARDLYVANVWGQCVSKLDLMARTNVMDFTPLPGDENLIYRKIVVEKIDPDNEDLQAIKKREESLLDPIRPDAPFPYACRLDDKRQMLYVSLWGHSCVAAVNLKSKPVVTLWPTQEHPNEMVLTRNGRRLYVANANRNTVTVLDTTSGKTIETLYASFSPTALPGSMPSSLALSPDENTLYVANACNNNVAVFDVSIVGDSHSLGFIPVGWFPTSVRVTPDGKRLLVANGKGLISKANPNGPVPGKKRTESTQAIDELFPGTLSIIDLPKGKQFQTQLAEWTQQAYLCTPEHSASRFDDVPRSANNPVPAKSGEPSPIKYCIYIVKENRTYDQILGDMTEGNGDAKLCLFPEKNTPNLHKIARDFVLLDNFYVDAEVSADGHEWSMGAFATDFVEKMWPFNYRKAKKFTYPAEGRFPIADPAGGYLWDRARAEGVSYFSFGEFTFNGPALNKPGFTREKALKGHFDPYYHGFDTGYLDIKRADRFLTVYKQFEAKSAMPHLIIIRLGNDHTSGGVAGKPTPAAQVADNDRAVGMIVEAVSHSSLWSQTAVFIVEDDAQNGPDHVDAHRSTAYVVSPYTRRHAVDSTMYSTSSLLRTMELILGLKPMSQYDAAAEPMFNVFQARLNPGPFDALAANINLNDRNPEVGMNSERSRGMDLTKEDAVDDHLMNEAIWHAVRGEDSVVPAPTRAAFVHADPKTDDKD